MSHVQNRCQNVPWLILVCIGPSSFEPHLHSPMKSRLCTVVCVAVTTSALIETRGGRTSPRLIARAFCQTSSGQNGNNNVIQDLRMDYTKKGLVESDIIKESESDPNILFSKWLQEAIDSKVVEPNAMCLSTSHNNRPSARYVLLKGHDDRGFVWYTNYNSRKSKELASNPYASLTFWWGDLERSVRVEGTVEMVSGKESDEYFYSRPRGSRIGAWSSDQSEDIADREVLEAQERGVIAKFGAEGDVPRPPHWGGFRLVPSRVEFWKGRSSRLHDRIVFERKEAVWKMKRLQP